MNGPLKDYSKSLAEEKKMAVYDEPNPASSNGSVEADAAATAAAAAVTSVADSDSCRSDDDDELEELEVEDCEAAAVTPAYVKYEHFKTACLDPAVFDLLDTDEESTSAVAHG